MFTFDPEEFDRRPALRGYENEAQWQAMRRRVASLEEMEEEEEEREIRVEIMKKGLGRVEETEEVDDEVEDVDGKEETGKGGAKGGAKGKARAKRRRVGLQ